MNILLLKPNCKAKCMTIDHSLESMQNIVGGYIEAVYPFDDAVAVVCNDEGLLQGLPLNRQLSSDVIIAGTCFLCGLGEDNFTDLPYDLMNKYKQKFELPHCFVRVRNSIMAIPFDPEGGDRDG